MTVHDPPGPDTDADANINIEARLPAPRQNWITARGDVETYRGRIVKPEDNGNVGDDNLVTEFSAIQPPLKAKTGKRPTQLAYARAGIMTAKMEFVSIRENQLREELKQTARDGEDFEEICEIMAEPSRDKGSDIYPAPEGKAG